MTSGDARYMKSYRQDPTVRERSRRINQRSSLRAQLALAHIKENDPKTYEAICTIVDKMKPLEEMRTA
jgi:hypothetical protein